jgi:DNA-binding GntR family transcriptional regulator
MSRPAPVPALSLAERAYHAIKAEILSNRLEPGAVLPMQRFAVEMKLSRTPVREAILRLEREGLVEIRPRLGTVVAHLDLRRLREMYHVRAVLEGEAARLACPLAPPEVLAAVEQELRRANSVETMSAAGQRLHGAISAHCGNAVLRETLQGLQDHFVRFRHVSLGLPGKVRASHQEHLRILEALKRRDGGEAERRVREHFEHAGVALIGGLLHQPSRGVPGHDKLHSIA